MNILLINHYAGSPSLGMEYRPYYFARHWVELGHNVTIVACTQSHVRNQSVANEYHEEIVDGVRYVWLPSLKYKQNGAKRVFNMFGFIAGLFFYSKSITKDFSPDVVVASSTYPLDVFPANYLAKKHNAKLVYEVHDLWPLSPVELGGMSTRHPFIRLLQWGEDYGYRHSDKVVSMLPAALEHMLSRGMEERKYVYIPNGIDLHFSTMQHERDAELESYIDVLKQGNKFVVAYAGTHGVANSLDTVLDAAKLYSNSNVHFLLIGSGPDRDKLVAKVEADDISNVTMWPAISRSKVHSALKKMDVLLLTLKNQPLFRFGLSPNKLFDYMYAAKPVIQAVNAGNDLVEDAQCGISVEGESPQALLAAIEEIKKMDVDEQEKLGINGFNYVRCEHEYKTLATKFLKAVL